MKTLEDDTIVYDDTSDIKMQFNYYKNFPLLLLTKVDAMDKDDMKHYCIMYVRSPKYEFDKTGPVTYIGSVYKLIIGH